jgi:hypothetical protein
MSNMTRSLSIGALAVAAGLAACGDSRSTDTSDIERDLQLASASTMNLAAPRVDPALLTSLETKPQGAPERAATVKRGPGTRAVRSEAPTVEATPDVDVAAVHEVEQEVQTESVAPEAEPTNEPVAVAPRPAPVVVQAGNAGDYGTSGGIFGGGGVGGVVIRGGGVDGDNCELHRRGRGGSVLGGGTIRGPVYSPSVPRTGGILIGGASPSRGGIGTRTMDRAGAVRTTVRGMATARRGMGR